MTLALFSVIFHFMNNPNKQPNKNKSTTRQKMAAGAIALTSIAGAVASPAGASGRTHETAYGKELTQLTKVIEGLDHGGKANITSHRVELPGPIGEGKGQPIVFDVKEKGINQTYFAYTQDALPNFNQKEPVDTAANMAIVKEPTQYKYIQLTEAHLNKADHLVGPNEANVGYSTGGNNSGK